MRISVRSLFVLGTFCLSVLLYVDRICISAAKDEIAAALALDDQQMGWILSVFALGYALFQTPGGWLADRLGPRKALAAIVIAWSAFTGLTAVAFNFISLLVIRFLFGAGEAGAFPGIARAAYSWIPMRERGLVQGINFSGSRVGGAASLVAIPAMIEAFGWRYSFVLLMAIGWFWAAVWYTWFRDDPSEHGRIAEDELRYILDHRQPQHSSGSPEHARNSLRVATLLASTNLWLVSLQYFCSNFTFFFCLTWLFPHMKAAYSLSGTAAGWYAATPLFCGAFGNWFAGWMVDWLYRRGAWLLSRRLPAILGFLFATAGLVASVRVETAWEAIAWFSLAVFGADMTLAPSWSCCIDIGKRHAGVISGTMNMAGNLGSFVTALAFPYLAAWTGSNVPFFFVAAGLCLLAAILWLLIDPRRELEATP